MDQTSVFGIGNVGFDNDHENVGDSRIVYKRTNLFFFSVHCGSGEAIALLSALGW